MLKVSFKSPDSQQNSDYWGRVDRKVLELNFEGLLTMISDKLKRSSLQTDNFYINSDRIDRILLKSERALTRI